MPPTPPACFNCGGPVRPSDYANHNTILIAPTGLEGERVSHIHCLSVAQLREVHQALVGTWGQENLQARVDARLRKIEADARKGGGKGGSGANARDQQRAPGRTASRRGGDPASPYSMDIDFDASNDDEE